ncbi:MAG: chitinase [Cytophagaceae bacterium]|nr:MAG: chitinase [Cytophagaceae bacterium]
METVEAEQAIVPLWPAITKEQLIACGGNKAYAGRYVEPLNVHLPEAKITTPLRFIHFMAQLLHESAALKRTEEYDSGAAYEGRKDLGNFKPGDGMRFKGRGLIQITGRANYTAASKALGIDYVNNPEWMERPDDAVRVSLWYWSSRNLNRYADQDNVLAISQIVNQGSIPKKGSKRGLPNGYAERRAHLGQCRAVFMAQPESKPKSTNG